MSELAIIADTRERQQKLETDPTAPDAYRWFDQPKRVRPNWVRTTVWHLGHLLVFIGHQLENSASNLASVSSKQFESM